MLRQIIFIFSFLILSLVPAYAEVQISQQDLKEALIKEFSNQGIDEEIELEIYGGQTGFLFENAKEGKILVSNLQYDESQNKFNAEVEIFADGKSVAKTELLGKYFTMEEVWVPVYNLEKGVVISQDDLKPIKVRHSRLKTNVVGSLDKLVGKETKRALKSGKLILNKEVGEKILVHKNDKVTLQYKTDKMQILARGIAQEDGAKGDKIEVENMQSRKKIYGIVISADTIEVDFQ